VAPGKIKFTCLQLAVLIILAGCGGAAVPDASEKPQERPEIAQVVSPQPEMPAPPVHIFEVRPRRRLVEDEPKPPEPTPIELWQQWLEYEQQMPPFTGFGDENEHDEPTPPEPTPQELWWDWMENKQQMPPFTGFGDENEHYVSAGFAEHWGDNIHLLENWVSMFERGEPAPPLHIASSHVDGISFVRLEYDGGPYFTATMFPLWWQFSEQAPLTHMRVHTSPHIIRRTLDYVIPIGLEYELFMSIPHTMIASSEIDYDLEAMPSLGAISPQEAVEIAQFRLGQSHSQWLRLGSSRSWFDPHREESVDNGRGETLAVVGASTINGELYYELVREDVAGAFFISADGAVMLGLFQGFWVHADANEVWITPPHRD